ncbi:MAG: hypothetical protein JOZ69_18955 [Myxococcales bacterium]|nr:hypothetical protein [Myxococcales bacterium]
MKAIVRVGCASSIVAAAAAVALAVDPACTTTEVNNDGGNPGSGSSSGGTGSSGGSSGGASSSSSSSSSGGGSVEAGPPPLPTCTAVPPGDGGAFLVSDFSTPLNGTTGADAYNTRSSQGGYLAGTYFYPAAMPAVAGPGLPGTDMLANPDAGQYCSVLWSQNSFVASVSPSTKSWVISGTVAGYSGFGFYMSGTSPCVDVSAYTGVRFVISGSVGNPGTPGLSEGGTVSDAGSGSDAATSSMQIQFNAGQADDIQVQPGTIGQCSANCTSPGFFFSVPSAPTVMTIHWSDLSGGAPLAGLTDTAHFTGFQWNMPWPCTGGVPYPVNITVRDVELVTQ